MYKNLLLIIIPRHTFRDEDIKKELIDLKMINHVHGEKIKIHKAIKEISNFTIYKLYI